MTEADGEGALLPAPDRAETGADYSASVQIDGKFFARKGRRLRVAGVTYGPFAPDADGEPFPAPAQVRKDFGLMQAAGINTIRTYHLPPEWLLDLADQQEMRVFIDVPWPKHLCFLDSSQAQSQARSAVSRAAQRGRKHPSVLAYSIGNEIPSTIVRWHGTRRVERFLRELMEVSKEADPAGLVTYANFPPTEFLNLSFLDFITFNVYLHNPKTFRRYLFRLQNLIGDKPLVLGEIGMDTLRHGEAEQARFLASHVRESVLAGLAGVFVFSWTDDWHTGGFPIEDWAFGITTRDRKPKESYSCLQDVFDSPPAKLLRQTPRVSVVVCTYNGGRSLDQCLRSLLELEYPDYEVIVVDDGSTDDTGAILARYPNVRTIRQANHGLSYARNVGLHAATGAIVAYTDSDCYADPDWLTHLVDQLQRTTAAAVGGPNLAPQEGWLAACVAAAPGQPTHVLESDQEAEHIPGCNMAFRRDDLLAINGFDYQYRKAGDDVDVCWRLQHAGKWITFAPGAFVWHHRRQTPRTYLKQQAGYGEAEALLRFKHPERFNSRGDGKWRGVLYGPSLQGLRLAEPIIYRGTFGTGMFQSIYQPAPAHWAMLPSTLEWQAAATALGLAGLLWWPGLLAMAVMFACSFLVAILQAVQARLAPRHEGFKARCLISVLCYLQPLVRSWKRYRTRVFAYRRPKADPEHLKGCQERLPLSGRRCVAYWTEHGFDRTELLGLVTAYLTERGWGKTVDSGWSSWDLEIYCHPWTIVQVATAQEDHGSDKRLIRVRYRLLPTGYVKTLAALATVFAVGAIGLSFWPVGLGAGVLVALCGAIWWSGTYRASQAVAVFEAMARQLGLVRCEQLARPAPETTAESMPLRETAQAAL
jgi:GT2 family glycosyltransferase